MADEKQLKMMNAHEMALRVNADVAGKLIRNEDTNDAVSRMDKVQQVANSIVKIKSEASPAPYTGRGSVWYCHYYNARPTVIPEQYREPKYIAAADDVSAPAGTSDGEMVRAAGFMNVKDYELKVIKKVKEACLKAKIGNQTELRRVDQLTNAKASMQTSINQLNAYKSRIDDYAKSHGTGAILPSGGRRSNPYGAYSGWVVGAAQNDIHNKTYAIEQNIKNTDAAIARAKNVATPELNEEAVNNVQAMKTNLAKLEHLQAVVDASDSIYRTMRTFDSYYDKNDRCATTCQVYCQQACQNACQNNCTCHDQHCGGF